MSQITRPVASGWETKKTFEDLLSGKKQPPITSSANQTNKFEQAALSVFDSKSVPHEPLKRNALKGFLDHNDIEASSKWVETNMNEKNKASILFLVSQPPENDSKKTIKDKFFPDLSTIPEKPQKEKRNTSFLASKDQNSSSKIKDYTETIADELHKKLGIKREVNSVSERSINIGKINKDLRCRALADLFNGHIKPDQSQKFASSETQTEDPDSDLHFQGKTYYTHNYFRKYSVRLIANQTLDQDQKIQKLEYLIEKENPSYLDIESLFSSSIGDFQSETDATIANYLLFKYEIKLDTLEINIEKLICKNKSDDEEILMHNLAEKKRIILKPFSDFITNIEKAEKKEIPSLLIKIINNFSTSNFQDIEYIHLGLYHLNTRIKSLHKKTSLNNYFNYILKNTISNNNLDEVKKIIMFFKYMEKSYSLKFDDGIWELLSNSDPKITELIIELTGEF